MLTGNALVSNQPELSRGSRGTLIVNADDWGRDGETTNRTMNCIRCGSVSSVSAMVFMEDSERAAALAREAGIDAGLHLNFTTRFSAPHSPSRLLAQQERLSRFLKRHRLAQAVFHPGLASAFQYVVAAQTDEFVRIYGAAPARIDGHHHMHLCTNVLLQGLLPAGTIARRNFSFQAGDKGLCNRTYRRVIDEILSRRHSLTDFLFALLPLAPADRLLQIFSLARRFVVEVETHPIDPQEHRFLTEGGMFRLAGDLRVASGFVLPRSAHAAV